jgi:hypothetical protein
MSQGYFPRTGVSGGGMTLLTQAVVRNARARDRAYKLFAERGLFLLVTPAGVRSIALTIPLLTPRVVPESMSHNSRRLRVTTGAKIEGLKKMQDSRVAADVTRAALVVHEALAVFGPAAAIRSPRKRTSKFV